MKKQWSRPTMGTLSVSGTATGVPFAILENSFNQGINQSPVDSAGNCLNKFDPNFGMGPCNN